MNASQIARLTSKAAGYFADNHTHRACANFTRDYATLVRLNKEKAWVLLPVMVYVLVLVTMGIIGNALVIHVYAVRFAKTPSNRFILWLAILDLITCVIGMPFEVYDLMRPLRFNKPWACSFFRFFTTTTIIASATVLIAVAFDRYHKAFKPFKRLKVRSANIYNGVTLVVALCLSWPAMLIFGRKSICVEIPESGIVILGSECSVDDSVRGTFYPFIYYGVLFLAYISLLVIKAVLYGKLGHEIIRRKKPDSLRGSVKSPSKSIDKESSSCMRVEEKSVSVSRRSHWQQTVIARTSIPETKEESIPMTNLHRGTTNNNSVNSQSLRRKKSSMSRLSDKFRAGRTTLILFFVSLAFIVSFLPFLVTKILQATIKNFSDFTTDTQEIVYNICTRTQFINNAINPIIYGFLNPNFRKECRQIFCRKRRTSMRNSVRQEQRELNNSC